MATKILDGVTTDVTSSAIRGPSGFRTALATFTAAGELDGGNVKVHISPTGSANTFVALVSGTIPGGGQTGLNVEFAPGFFLAAVVSGASTSTSVDVYAGVGLFT